METTTPVLAAQELRAPLPRASNGMIVAAVFVAGLASLAWNERIPVNEGLGWDGIVFVQAAAHPRQALRETKGTGHMIQRILPSAIVHISLRTLGIERTNRNILRGFRTLTLLLIALATLAWCECARELQITTAGKWLGAAVLFSNFALLKMSYYYPNLTDPMAFTLGLGMLLFYLRRNDAALVCLTILAAFTLQTAFLVGVLFLLFPRSEDETQSVTPRLCRAQAITVGAVCTILLAGYLASFWIWGWDVLKYPTEPLRPLLAVSIAISAFYFYVAVSSLLNSSGFQLSWVRAQAFIRSPRPWLVGLLVAAIVGIWRILAAKPGLTMQVIIGRIFWSGVTSPGMFLVAHTLYFGPIMLVLVWLWREIVPQVHRYGMGLTMVVLLAAPFSLMSESRNWINFFPILAVLTVKALDARQCSRNVYLLIALLTFVGSRWWLPLNGNFPERYFDCQGPWMTLAAYLWNLAFAVAMACLLVIVIRLERRIGIASAR